MQCTSPRTVGFKSDGKTISWSQKQCSKEFASFQLPCGKCIECRLGYARQWAIRCVHEAQMHSRNCFITLTYDEDHLVSPYLQYRDFQLFMKRLRKTQNEPIGCFVTGEYGEQTKRPHWHAIIFNWCPRDSKPKYKNNRGDQIYSSEHLTKLWRKGNTDYGSVTIESAGYVARYAAKKLGHSPSFNDKFVPISKKSSKHAIGKKWLEKYWPDVFNQGMIILLNGQKAPIPRYYEKWLQKNQPERWKQYVTETKARRIKIASEKNKEEAEKYLQRCRENDGQPLEITATQMRVKIIKQKFKQLQDYLKL